MAKSSNKTLAVFLAAAMISTAAGIIPMSTSAAETSYVAASSSEAGFTFDYSVETNEYDEDSYIVITKCTSDDENITVPASIDNIPVRIIGSGAFVSKENLKEVNLPDSIERIENSAFEYCHNLESISMPKNLKYIGDWAFSDCYKLKAVEFPDGIEEISSYAFRNCDNFEEVTLPSSLKRVGYEAFLNMDFLKTVTIKADIETMENRIFAENASLVTVNLPNDLSRIPDSMFAACASLKSIKIPDSVKYIYNYGLADCSNLKTITFGSNSSLEGIGYCSFQNDISLSSVTLPKNVKSIDQYAFRYSTNLKSIQFNSKLESIGYRAFEHCTSLEKITIPDSMTGISGYVFDSCTALKSVKLGSGLTSISDHLFLNCINLEFVVISDNIEIIRYNAFENCKSLKSVTVGKSLNTIESAAFYGCNNLENFVNIPDNQMSIEHNSLLQTKWYENESSAVYFGNNLYSYKGTLNESSLVIKEGTTKINRYSFNNASNLKSITIPASLESVDFVDIFGNCDNLENIIVDENNPSYKSVDGMVYSADGSVLIFCPRGKQGAINVLDETSSIENYALSDCENITSINIGKTFRSVSIDSLLTLSSLSKITISEENVNFSVDNDVLYNKDKTYAYFCPPAKSGKIVIPETVTGVNYRIFRNCTKITSVTLPSSDFYLYTDNFSYCPSLTEIKVNSENTRYSSVNGVLYNKEKTQLLRVPQAKTGSLSIAETTESISGDAFYNCSKLTSVTIPDITDFSDGVFDTCTALIKFVVSENNANYSAYDGMLMNKDNTRIICVPKAKTEVTLPVDSYGNIRNEAFNNCTKLTTLNLGSKFYDFYWYTFENCSSLKKIVVDASNPYFASENGILYNKRKTELIYVPEGYNGDLSVAGTVSSVSYRAFWNCKNMTSVTFGKDLTGSIDLRQFNTCSSLTAVNFHSNNDSYTSEDGIVFNKAKTAIYYYPNNKSGDYTLPVTVTSMDNDTFENCKALTNLTVSDGFREVNSTFAGCTSLKTIKIPENVISINSGIFDDLDTLVIEGYDGSAAEIYANTNDITFKVLSREVEIDKTNVNTAVGRSTKLSAVITSSRTTDNTVTWTSANPAVAVVDDDGNVTAVSAGSTTITAKTADGSTATSDFIVNPEVTNNSSISAEEIILGDGITFNAAANGGVGDYTYAMYAKLNTKSNWTTVSKFSETASVDYKPSSAGTYDMCIKVKDSEGYIVSKYFTLVVSETLKNNSEISSEKIALGDTTVITGQASGGIGKSAYEYSYKLSSDNSWTTLAPYSSSTSMTVFKPTKVGTYDIRVDAKDSSGKVESKTFTLTVTGQLANNSTLSASAIVIGDNITAKAVAEGGISAYTYAFYYKEFTSSKWTNLSGGYAAASETKITPNKAGYYQVCVKVKDQNSSIAVKYLNLIVNDTLKNNSTLESSSITLGDSVKVNAAAADGMGGYTYAVYYKKTTDSSWTKKSDYVSSTSFEIKPAKAASYDICVKVKDSAGNITNKYLTLNVINKLENTSTVSEKITYGNKISVKASATGGNGEYMYSVYYKKTTDKAWVKTDYMNKASIEIAPSKVAVYDVCVNVKDEDGNVAKKYFTVNVIEELVNNSTVASERIKLGEKISVKADAAGGSGGYTYAVYYKKTTDKAWVKKDYVSDTSFELSPSKAAVYDVCVFVKDSDGNVTKKYFTVNVVKELENTSTVSENIVLGGSIVVKASATGGSGEYTYVVHYKKTTDKSWTKKSDYVSSTSFEIKPAKATTYDVCVKVKDSEGNISKKYFTVNVTEPPVFSAYELLTSLII